MSNRREYYVGVRLTKEERATKLEKFIARIENGRDHVKLQNDADKGIKAKKQISAMVVSVQSGKTSKLGTGIDSHIKSLAVFVDSFNEIQQQVLLTLTLS